MVRGAIPGTRSNLQYLFELGNGRSGSTADAEREARDDNDGKALNGGIAFLPDRWRGLEVGGSFRRDLVPQQGGASIEERITALYAVYRTPATEVLAEWLTMAMRPRDGTRYRDSGGYAQVSHSWKMARPYYRFDRLAVDADTPLIGHAGSYTAHVLGLRLDPAASIGFKAQYERTDVPGHPHSDGVRTQLVFVY